MPALLAPQNLRWNSETPKLQLQTSSSVGVPVILAELSLGEEVTPRSDAGDWHLLSIPLIFWDALPYIINTLQNHVWLKLKNRLGWMHK